MRYELTDNEWSAIKPMLPNKPRGVARVTTGMSSTASFRCWGPGRLGAICP
jgi:transposase